MHPRIWVYQRNTSKSLQSRFCSKDDILQKAGCCISGFLGLLFLSLAIIFLLSPRIDKEKKLFFIFTGLFAFFKVMCLMYCFIYLIKKCCRNSDRVVDGECPKRSLLSSEETISEGVPVKEGIASYQACAGYPEVPSFQDIPSYQSGPSYPEVSGFPAVPYGAAGGYHPGLGYYQTLANHEAVFAQQQIPLYQRDLLEPQLPPHSGACRQIITVPKSDIYVY